MRPLATFAVVAALAVVGCGDDEPTAQELPVRTVTVPTETVPETLTETTTTDTTTSPSQPPSATPEGTGGAAPAPPSTTPAAPPAVTTPKGTGGISPGGEEDQEGGAGDEDPTASPGGAAAP